MFIFLWTLFAVAVIILLLALNVTYRAHITSRDTRRAKFGDVKCRDEEKGDLLLKDGVMTVTV